MAGSPDVSPGTVRSLIPARMDRLPWTGFHTRLVMSLGTAWVLDGLEITLASSVAGVLTEGSTLHLSSAAVGAIATVYLVGEVAGALLFGRMSDALGRRKLFMVTLGVYLIGSGLTAATSGASAGWVAFLYLTRFVAGMGIGGEYAAINSAIDEMIPARSRGRVDIGVNGTYWAGSIIGTLASLAFLNWIGASLGWRLAFLVGPALAVVILFIRRTLPESPRWQLTHGHAAEAESGIAAIEATVVHDSGRPLPPVNQSRAIEVRPAKFTGYLTLLKLVFTSYWRRAVLGATLMITQSFLYNAIFFTYTLVLTRFYGVSATSAPLYLIAFAAGNLAGPLVLGRLYDTIGRKPMISSTYLASGVMLIISGYLFDQGVLDATTQTIAWAVIFFFASAGASSAYLTVSETFPVEIRAEAIAVFFAIAQVFGAIGPVLFGALIGTGNSRTQLFIGYAIGGGAMIVGGVVELLLGVPAERKELEQVARPLTAVTATQVPRATLPQAHYSPSSRPGGTGSAAA
ncbi:MAG TPA: MFS transporter [Streptosporangiaceae bacterium]|jgi:MFS family permease|nr:MFS transporter [Streptosporangiaceae bacterium]